MKSILCTLFGLITTTSLLLSQVKSVPDNQWDDQFINGNAPNNVVNSIFYSNNEAYIGGEFTDAGGSTVNYLARWDETGWYNIGGGFNGKVQSILVSNNLIYVGGNFTTAGATSANNLAVWDGTQWSDVGGGLNGEVFSIAEKDGYIYVGGIFSLAGTTSVNNIACWDGTTWTALGTGVNDTVFVIKNDGTNLIVGGKFTNAGGVANSSHIAGWDNTNWFSLGTGADNTVRDIITGSGSLYAAGDFINAGGITVNHFAKWDGTSWNNLGTGINGIVNAIVSNGSNIYIGGAFTDADGLTVSNICKYDGINYSTLGSGVDDTIKALEFTDYELLAGGKFQNAGGKSSVYFARWISPPIITNHPAYVDACENDTVTFSVSVQGTPPFTYQWLLNGSNIAGATDSFYTIYGTVPADSGNYQCVVMNAADTVTSNIAALTMHLPPTITVDPVNYAGCEGTTASFSVTATSTISMTYQWQHFSSDISGANAYLYTIPSLTIPDTGLYHCIVSNQCGSDTSQDAKLMVYPTPTVYFTGLDLNYCNNYPPDTLTPYPTGGTFTGSGMTDSIFSPNGLLGTFTISYSYTDIHGCSDIYTKDVDVHGLPSVSFTGLNSDYCVNGTHSNLNGTPSGGIFSGNGINGVTFYPDSAGIGTFNIVYLYTDSNACTNTDTQSVVVHELPNIFIGNDTSICLGQTYYINMTGDFGMYGWDFTTTTNTSIAVNPVSDTSYSGWIMSSYGCLSRDTINIDVNPIPSAVSFTGLDSVYCNTAGPDTLTTSPSGGIFSGQGFVGNIFHPTALTPGNHEVIYIYTDTNGCSNSDTASTYIKPVMSISFTGLNAQYCANDEPDTLSGTPSGGTFSGGNITGNIFSPALSGSGNHNIVYQYPDTNGCIAYDTIPVLVFPLPNITTTNDTAVCEGDSVLLIAHSDSAQYYFWSTLDNTDSIMVTPTTTTTYFITVSNGYCYNSDSIKVQFNPLPVVDLGGNQSLCRDDSLNAGSGYAVYNWTPAFSTDSILLVNQSGNYAVTVTTSEGCQSTDQANITVMQTPVVDLGNDLSITTEQTTVLGIGGSYDSYLWSTGDTTSLISVIGDSLGLGQHYIWAEATNSNGCSDVDTIIINITYGLSADGVQFEKLWIYPNPANEFLYIKTNINDDAKFQIFNETGKICKSGSINNKTTRIDVNNLSPGIYIMVIKSERFNKINKIIIK